MRMDCLALLFAVVALAASAADAQVMPAQKRVPELGYKVVTDFFEYPANWIEGEAAGVAVNSKGHIYLFERQTKFVGIRAERKIRALAGRGPVRSSPFAAHRCGRQYLDDRRYQQYGAEIESGREGTEGARAAQ